MEEQKTQEAVQTDSTPVESSTRPEQPVPSVAETLREAASETASDSVTPEDRRGGDDTEKKPRLERRVDKLVDKLKQVGQQQIDPNLYASEELFTKEELEAGTFDPTALQQRLAQREQRVQVLASQQALAAVKYESDVQSHIADMDVVKNELGNDPTLDELVSKQYDALNHQVDPRTGMRIFVPTVKMSDIYKQFKDVMDRKATEAAANVQTKVQQQASEQAVPVSVSQAPSQDFESQEALDRAKKTGQIEDWAAVLKKRMKS